MGEMSSQAAAGPGLSLPEGYHVGISGWCYPEWRGCFYPDKLPQKEFFGYYLRHFDTVEINNTFYHTPRPQLVRQWYEATPPDFLFSVKASRYITHVKKLKVEAESITRFFSAIEPLAEKTGPILFQLPPRWKFNPERLSGFLKILPKGYRYTFELRDPDWLREEAADILARHNAAFCAYSLKGFESPRLATADFAYVRLHGPLAEPYLGEYGAQALQGWALDFQRWHAEGREIFCYFDNTKDASAIRDAGTITRQLSQPEIH